MMHDVLNVSMSTKRRDTGLPPLLPVPSVEELAILYGKQHPVLTELKILTTCLTEREEPPASGSSVDPKSQVKPQRNVFTIPILTEEMINYEIDSYNYHIGNT